MARDVVALGRTYIQIRHWSCCFRLDFGPFRNKSKYERTSVYLKNVACAAYKYVSPGNLHQKHANHSGKGASVE